MDRPDIKHLAVLAELSLSPDEETALAADISRILAYVKELESLDTSDVEATAQVVVAPSDASRKPRSGDGWREDRAEEGLAHDDALREAPRAEHGGFSVPTFVE